MSGRSKPVSRLKNVVLPAPLGPISAVITPRWISTCSTSTAVRPPNCRTMLSATRIGSGLGAPGSRGDVRERAARGADADAGAGRRLRVGTRPRRPWARGHGQRASSASSLRSPKIPCGRKIINSISPRPRKMKRIRPAWLVSMIDDGMSGSAPPVAWLKNVPSAGDQEPEDHRRRPPGRGPGPRRRGAARCRRRTSCRWRRTTGRSTPDRSASMKPPRQPSTPPMIRDCIL